MRQFLKEREHLVRMALVFLVGLLLFLVLRTIFVPKDFGREGHFRSGAIPDNASRPLAFAGREACEICHADVAETRKGSRHAAIGCEACHGALGQHAEDPGRLKPTRPDAGHICLVCHRIEAAKPKGFPQVDPQTHARNQPCNACHTPHHPEMK